MTHEVKGVVKEVGQTMTFPSGFSKREIVVDIAEKGSKYPNEVPFQAKKDRCGILDGFRRGDEVAVKFAIDGRSYDGDKGLRRFVDVTVISISKVGSSAGANAAGDSGDDVCPDDGMPF